MMAVGVGRPASSSFRKPGLLRPKFQKPELPRPGPAEGEAALAAPLRTLYSTVNFWEENAWMTRACIGFLAVDTVLTHPRRMVFNTFSAV